MEISQVTAFLAVAEELHFGRAAERLHMAQPPLSRIIKQLERELGSELFERTTRRVRLTTAGQALVAPARELIEGARVARAAVQSAGEGETGTVRLGFAGPSTHELIGRLSRAVRERHPGIELSLQSTTYVYEALRQVMAGELDVSIVRWDREPPGIAHRVIAVEHYVLAVATDHPFAGRSVVTMAECQDEAFVALPADPGSSVRDAFIRSAYDAGFAPDIVQVAPDSWTALALVAAGVGITFTIDTAVHAGMEGVVIVPLAEGMTPVYARLAWRRDDSNPALREVLRAGVDVLPTPPGVSSDPNR